MCVSVCVFAFSHVHIISALLKNDISSFGKEMKAYKFFSNKQMVCSSATLLNILQILVPVRRDPDEEPQGSLILSRMDRNSESTKDRAA